MPLPIILAGVALFAGGYGVKKGIDGYKSHSEADEIIENTKSNYNSQKSKFDAQEKRTQTSLEQLGKMELDIGASFNEWQTLAEKLLAKINAGRQKEISINFPQHKLKKIESYRFAAMGVLGSVAGSGVAGVAAGFAVYGGVMTFAAASTGTAISTLSGVAATNATLAAIGGGAISAGGLGMAGGTAILGAAVAAPVLAIAGWAYSSHGEAALENAKKARDEANAAIEKLIAAAKNISSVESYALKILKSIAKLYADFKEYLDILKYISGQLDDGNELTDLDEVVGQLFQNGYSLASILTDIITVPLFKLKKNKEGELMMGENGIPIREEDANGFSVLDSAAIDKVLV
jgi:hypothetical protein